VTVSRSFFESPEFQSRGYFIIRVYQAAYKRNPLYGEFMNDLSSLSGATPEESNALREGFIANFMTRGEFRVTGLGGIPSPQYVDQLIANTGLTFSNRDALVASLDAMQKTRAQVLREVVEHPAFATNQGAFNRAFVLAEYFGYLRRNPFDAPNTDFTGYDFWLGKLNDFNGNYIQAEMVKAFITSDEYRNRFVQ
jgi:hypothetical protein